MNMTCCSRLSRVRPPQALSTPAKVSGAEVASCGLRTSPSTKTCWLPSSSRGVKARGVDQVAGQLGLDLRLELIEREAGDEQRLVNERQQEPAVGRHGGIG